GQRTGVGARLPADLAEARIDGRVVLVRSLAIQYAARTELRTERRLLRIVSLLRLFLGIQVIQVAVELVEAVHGRQEVVAIAEVVLAELPGHVAERLEHFGDGRILLAQAERRARQADLRQSGAQSRLARNEGGAAGSATLLRVVVGEHHSL